MGLHTVEEKVLEIAKKKLVLEDLLINPIRNFSKDDMDSVIKIGASELFGENYDVDEEEIT